MKRIVVGVTGATGVVLASRVLSGLRDAEVETHLVLSRWGRATLALEANTTSAELRALADYVYSPDDAAAPISSGSFRTDGMIIVPCSMKTLAACAHGYDDGLIARAAGVTIKERRRLVVVPRELPFSVIHLENMLALARAGAVIAPPVPTFYTRPASLDDLLDDLAARILDQLDVAVATARRWSGPTSSLECGTGNGLDAYRNQSATGA